MRTQHVFRLALLVLLGVCGMNAAPISKLHGVSSPDAANPPRSLRAAATVDGESPRAGEERGVSSAIKNALTKRKIKSWVASHKSDDFVMKALGMEGVAGAALKAHPKYKTFQEFKVANWLKTNTPTSTVWDDLGLSGLSLAQVRSADGFDTYTNYVLAYDEKFMKYWRGDTTKEFKIIPGNSRVEEAAKAAILDTIGRDYLHIRMMQLGSSPLRRTG
jgi:hypothetical protein